MIILPSCPFRSLSICELLSGQVSRSNVLHHGHELFEVDLAVAVLVDLADGLLELRPRVQVLHAVAREQLGQLTLVDFPTTILVEHVEGRLQVRLSHEHRLVHRRRQEL